MIPTTGGGGGRSFPALGFDPAPGDLGEVEALVRDLARAVTSLGEGAGLLDNLSAKTGSDWQGKAADTFREHASNTLPKALHNAHDSFAKAQRALKGWSADLSEYQRTADTLERHAEQAKADVASAEQQLADVNANPYHVTGPDPTGELAARAQHLQAQAMDEATGQVNTARGSLDDIIHRARNLQGEHDHQASATAKALEAAPNHLAPRKPGLFDSIGHWVSDHASDIARVLDDVSAVAGLVALIPLPPLDAIALGVAVASSLGAAGLQAYKGQYAEMGMSLVGALPGIGVVKDAAVTADAATTIAQGVEFARGAESASDVAFGARYALSGVTDTLKAAPQVAKDSLEETQVLGSPLSRAVARGFEKIPGVTVHDGLGLAANIEKITAAAGAGMGGANAGAMVFDKTTGSDWEIPGEAAFEYTHHGYDGFGSIFDLTGRAHLPFVRVP